MNDLLCALLKRLGMRGPPSARVALAVLLGVCIARAAFAADPLSIRVEPPGAAKRAALNSRWDVYLDGAIEAGAARRVSRELEQIGDDGADVYVNSPGGSLADGMAIGRELRRLKASTTVATRAGRDGARGPGQCYSACVFIFLGGVYRNMPEGSVLGVHRASTSAHSDQDFDVGQVVAARVSHYIADMGVDPGLVDRMVLAGKDEIYVLSPAELLSLRVVNQGRLPPKWTTEVSGRSEELIGEQETSQGLGKAIFDCERGVVTFHSIYQAGANAPAVAAEDWAHALLVDDVSIPLGPPAAIQSLNGFLSAIFVLSPDEVRQIAGANSVGHVMQGGRDEPESLGYKIDIDGAAANRVHGFMDSCANPS